MTQGEMREEFARLTALGAPKNAVEQDQRERFAHECYRLYAWMPPAQWKQTINLVIERHKRGSYTIEEFRAAVSSLRERGVVKTEACRSCGGTKWHYVSLKLADESMVDAVRPCASCRPGMAWNPIPDTVSYPMEDSWAVRMAKSMSSKVAYQVLERGNSMGIKFETDAVAIMTEKAALYEAEVETRREQVKMGTAHPLGVSMEAVVRRVASVERVGNDGLRSLDHGIQSPLVDEPAPFI